MHALPHRRSNALAALAFSGLLAFAVSFSLAMAALHRAPLWRVVLSLPAALFLAGLVFAIPGLD